MNQSAEASPEGVQKRLAERIENLLAGRVFRLPDNAWEYGLTFGTKPEDLSEVMKELRDGTSFLFNMLIDITAVDWLDRRAPRFDVVYQLMSLTYMHRLCLKVRVGEENPQLSSVRPLWPAAGFLEREVWDMFGIRFEGHGDLRRLLMYDEFVGHPLRKDYPLCAKQPRIPLRAPEMRNTSADMKRPELAPGRGSSG